MEGVVAGSEWPTDQTSVGDQQQREYFNLLLDVQFYSLLFEGVVY